MRICPACGHENSDRAKFCEECAAPLAVAPATREQRKTVTVLFCDLTGSTALGESTDPEPLRALLARYFERMRGIVESHGGTVEKFIGDAVMAVFGVPQAHEDDALRAVRAAREMRDALPTLGVQARIGINTGEVVTGTEERLATGDAVNVAARLEQAARPGDVLLGEATFALVREAVEVEALEPLELKGKGEPVPAYRLVSVHEAPERRHETPFVGRVGARSLRSRSTTSGRCHEKSGPWQRVERQASLPFCAVLQDFFVSRISSRCRVRAFRDQDLRDPRMQQPTGALLSLPTQPPRGCCTRRLRSERGGTETIRPLGLAQVSGSAPVVGRSPPAGASRG